MNKRLEPYTFGQGLNPLNNKFSILCTVMNSSRFMNSCEQYRFMNSDRYFGKCRKKSVKTRYITDKKPKFRRTDNRKGISCRDAPIHEISADISDFSNLAPHCLALSLSPPDDRKRPKNITCIFSFTIICKTSYQ